MVEVNPRKARESRRTTTKNPPRIRGEETKWLRNPWLPVPNANPSFKCGDTIDAISADGPVLIFASSGSAGFVSGSWLTEEKYPV